MHSSTKAYFQNLKVIELAAVLAGPAVGMFFAELGAQVIKVENAAAGGDLTRRWRLPSEDPEAPVSAYYCAVNWGKESVQLDLTKAEDQAQLHAWVKEADVVISNFKTQAAKRLGADYECLRSLNPQLIYAELSGFGADSERLAFDVVLQAEAGFLFMNGHPKGMPVKMPVALIDILAAHQLKEGILIALLQRAQTGKGSRVRSSLIEAAIASLANQATNWLMGGHIPQRMGSLHPNIAPYGEILEDKGGQRFLLAIGTDKQFARFCTIIDRPHLAAHPRYATNEQRVQHRAALLGELQARLRDLEATTVLEACHKAGVPAGRIRDMQAVFEQAIAQSMLLHEKLEGMDTTRVRSIAFQIETAG